MKKLILILFLILALTVPGWGADRNIYLDNGGAGAGTEGDPYGAFSEINWTTGGDNSIYDWVAAGDDVHVNLKKGVTWREQLSIGTSGASGHPITIQPYSTGANPIINGADDFSEAVVGQYTEDGGDYYTGYTTQPSQVFANGSRLTEVAAKVDLDQNTEWWDDTSNNRIYLNYDPDSDLIEATIRDAVTLNNDDYITIDSLTLTKGTYGIQAINGSTDLTVTDSTLNWNYYDGAIVNNADSDNATFTDCTAHDNGRHGVNWYDTADNGTVSGGTFYNHTATYGCGVAFSGAATNGTVTGVEAYNNYYGLKSAGAGGTGHTFEKSYVHDNTSFGIDADTGCTSNIVQYNRVIDNGSHGIAIEFSDNNIVRYNWVEDNGAICGIQINGSDGADVYGNIIHDEVTGIVFNGSLSGEAYNNTIYNSSNTGIQLWATSTSCTLRNNLIDTAGSYVIYVPANSQSGFTSNFNNFGAAAGNKWYWDGALSFANWQAIPQDANSSNSASLMVDPANDNFSLQSSSPCIDAGVNLGSPYNNALHVISTWPDQVQTLNQDNFGSDWEIGAYIFFTGAIISGSFELQGGILQ